MNDSVWLNALLLCLLEGCVVWLQHGLVAQNGGASSGAQVSGICIDVVGRRPVKFVNSVQKKLFPVLQGLNHGVAEGGRYWQVYNTQAHSVMCSCSIRTLSSNVFKVFLCKFINSFHRHDVPVKSRPASGRKFLMLWWASFTMTRRIRAQLREAQTNGQEVKNRNRLLEENKEKLLWNTCRSWDQSALSSVCQKGRRHPRLRHPLHRSRLNHTERCCLTGAGRAEGGKPRSGKSHDETPTSWALPYFGHKVVPHAQLWWDKLLPVRGSVCGNRRWRGRAFLHRASWDQHPHVEPTSVSIHILCWWNYRGAETVFFKHDKICLQHSVCWQRVKAKRQLAKRNSEINIELNFKDSTINCSLERIWQDWINVRRKGTNDWDTQGT